MNKKHKILLIDREAKTAAYLNELMAEIKALLGGDTFYTIQNDKIVDNRISHLDYHYGFSTDKITKSLVNRLKNFDGYKLHFVILNMYSDNSKNFSRTRGIMLGRILDGTYELFKTREEAENNLAMKRDADKTLKAFVLQNSVGKDYDFEANGYRSLGVGNTWISRPKEADESIFIKMKLSAQQYIMYSPLAKLYYYYDTSD